MAVFTIVEEPFNVFTVLSFPATCTPHGNALRLFPLEYQPAIFLLHRPKSPPSGPLMRCLRKTDHYLLHLAAFIFAPNYSKLSRPAATATTHMPSCALHRRWTASCRQLGDAHARQDKVVIPCTAAVTQGQERVIVKGLRRRPLHPRQQR